MQDLGALTSLLQKIFKPGLDGRGADRTPSGKISNGLMPVAYCLDSLGTQHVAATATGFGMTTITTGTTTTMPTRAGTG